jgi:predicted nucleic acid-binding protein
VKRLAGGAVLDASVGVKLVVAEPGYERAREVLGRALHEETPMAAPEFMALEVANALWAKARRRQLTPALAQEGLNLFLRATARFLRVPERVLAADALAIALECGVTAYDGCYLALARRLSLPLLTADAKLRAPPVRRGFDVVLLGELRDLEP